MLDLPGVSADWEADAGIEELVRIAEISDRLGFHHLTCGEHVAVPENSQSAMLSGTRGTTYWDLPFLAARTQRIRLCINVLMLGQHHPIAIAKRYATTRPDARRTRHPGYRSRQHERRVRPCRRVVHGSGLFSERLEAQELSQVRRDPPQGDRAGPGIGAEVCVGAAVDVDNTAQRKSAAGDSMNSVQSARCPASPNPPIGTGKDRIAFAGVASCFSSCGVMMVPGARALSRMSAPAHSRRTVLRRTHRLTAISSHPVGPVKGVEVAVYAVTGSASGMGRELASKLRVEGHTVVGVDLAGADVVADLSTELGR